MKASCSMFSQILKLIPRTDFERIVRESRAEFRSKGLSSWSQFVVMLFCQLGRAHSKETAMVGRFTKGFEEGLQKIAAGLTKPRGEKRHAQLLERIGRLKQKSRGASQHYQLTLSTVETGKTVTGL